MAKQLFVLLVIAIIVGGVYFFLNYEIQTQYENGKSAYWKIMPKGASGTSGHAFNNANGAPSHLTIRVATFEMGRLDEAKLANHRVSDVLMRLLPRFDLIALQGVRGKNQGVLVRLVEQMNHATGRTFDFATCPTQQRDGIEHFNAFVFDRDRIDIDRTTVHFVEDRSGRLRIKPLVGAFRAHGPNPAEAFTFTLINVENDSDRTSEELDVLADVYRAVRDDGRGEDDIILLGNLESDDQHLGQLGKLLGVSALLSGSPLVPTTTRGTSLADNVLLDRRATCEFTGRIEVVDMMREFDLTMPEAQEVSEHLPVWAEFSVYEGGQAGHAANTF
jgi:hypothetical protein